MYIRPSYIIEATSWVGRYECWVQLCSKSCSQLCHRSVSFCRVLLKPSVCPSSKRRVSHLKCTAVRLARGTRWILNLTKMGVWSEAFLSFITPVPNCGSVTGSCLAGGGRSGCSCVLNMSNKVLMHNGCGKKIIDVTFTFPLLPGYRFEVRPWYPG